MAVSRVREVMPNEDRQREKVDNNYHRFPSGYYLDLSEPHLRILKRSDSSMVAAFFPEMATKETLRRAAAADYEATLRREFPPEAEERSGA